GWRNLDPGTEVGHDEILHGDIQERMEKFLRRFAPDLQITHRWSGIMGFSRDSLPVVGPARGAPGALVAAGFTGHGFGFAFLAGKALADIVSEGRHPFADQMDPRRFS
ncbi:MAG TPA: FAD-dependent oxidoreductase, partial [Myxococcota bacterium]|nr:FAD-dependent oxidoreductase [Myxococcota bacterium]